MLPQQKNKIDLHIHSNYSDGTLSPHEIIDFAVGHEITTISITDHDSTNAYSKETISYAKAKNVNLIVGVEISTKLTTGFHVLGYNFDLNNAVLQTTLQRLRNARIDYLYAVCKKLNELGYVINPNDLKDIPSVTKAHIATNIVTNSANQNLLQQIFGHIPNKGEFIETIMNEGCPAYVEKFSITPNEASNIIHEAGGKVVLAHPVCYGHEDGVSRETIKSIATQMQADGIEAYYLYVNYKNQLIDETAEWNQVAKDLNVFTTIGSDFHSPDPLRPMIGFTNTNFKISSDESTTILDNLKS